MTVGQLMEKMLDSEEVQIKYACFNTCIYKGPAIEVPDGIRQWDVELIYLSVVSPALIVEAFEPIDQDEFPDILII